jgi:CBS domain-containing protein
MDFRYHVDPDTGLPHIDGHGVTEVEVEHVVRHPGEDRAGRDGSRHALGQTAAGRYLPVIYVLDEEGDGVFVVTAYDIRGKPLKAYRKRRRR